MLGTDRSESLPSGHGEYSVVARKGNDAGAAVFETGADNGDVNTLIAGVLTGDGYRFKVEGWQPMVVP